MMLAQMTPTQREIADRSRAFHAAIAARAVTQKQPAERTFAVKGDYARPKPADPVQELKPARVEILVWPVIPVEQPEADANGKRPDPLLSKIKREICLFYNKTESVLISERKTADVVYPRQIAMYLCKVLTTRSLPEIGRRFGDRDHSTVIFAVLKIQRNILQDENLAHEIAVLIENITGVQK